MLPAFSCACVLLGSANAPADPSSARIELLALDVEGVEVEALERALQTRLPDRARIPAGNPDARGGVRDWGYVLVRPVEKGWTLALILADGRAYYRNIPAPDGGDPARLIASTLSNLIASVEEDALVADAQNVPVPDEVPDPDPDPELEPELEPEPTPAPLVEAPPTETPAPPTEFGVTLGGLALWQLGPPRPGGFAGAGAEVSVTARRSGGLLLGGAFGGWGRSAAGYSLARLRLAAFAGYGLRRGRFELLSVAGASAQPWLVRGRNGSESLRSGQDDRSVSAVFGGFVQTSPGVLLRAGEARVRIGPMLRLSGAATTQGGGGIARVLQQTEDGPQALFRIGGLELTTGLEVTLWWTFGSP